MVNPRFTISETAADNLAKIVEMVVRLELGTNFKTNLHLHRANRIKSIYSSLAIEGNLLNLETVTALINGKRVVGPKNSVKEVLNAHQAYAHLLDFSPYSVEDFLRAHQMMTHGLIKESGIFRNKDVGVFNGKEVIHVGARPQFVPSLIEALFGWAQDSKLHPIIKSAIVHYEIEVIHPFADGNGRMGRLWHTAMLREWNPLFAWIPMESILYEQVDNYYQAIRESTEANDSAPFIEFSLSTLLEEIMTQISNPDDSLIVLTQKQLLLLKELKKGAKSRKELLKVVKMAHDSRTIRRLFNPLFDFGLIEFTISDKPTSRNQKYQITQKGREFRSNK